MAQIRRGNPAAIQQLLHQQLRGRTVDIQVVRKASLLCLYFTSDPAPERREILPLVERSLRHIATPALTVAKVRGYTTGVEEAAWSGRILLQRPQARATPGGQSPLSSPLGRALGLGIILLIFWVLGAGLAQRQPSDNLASDAQGGVPEATPDQDSESEVEQLEAENYPLDDGLIRIGNLSPHRLREQEIFDGKRIQIDTNDANLSREACMALVEEYMEAAGGPDGKIVVQKPNPQSPWNGKRAPYCENNMDGLGTYFNDAYFDDIP